MAWEVEYTDEFEAWWGTLSGTEQDHVAKYVDALKQVGPQLGYPYSKDIKSSRHAEMRELRPKRKEAFFRVLFAFDPRRTAILLLGGNKVGDKNWYKDNVPLADKLYDDYLAELREEGVL